MWNRILNFFDLLGRARAAGERRDADLAKKIMTEG